MSEPRWIELVIPQNAEIPEQPGRGATRVLFGSVAALGLLAAFLLGPTTVAESRDHRQVRTGQLQLAAAMTERDPWQLAGGAAGARDVNLAQLLLRANSVAASEPRTSVGGLLRTTVRTPANSSADSPWLSPTHGRVTSPFLRERFHPVLQRPLPHRGIDISAPWGSLISAPWPGVVVFVGTDEGYGKVVVLYHGAGVETRYAHCAQILVREGQYVHPQQPIALVGDTGLSTGPHLHYEVMVNGRHVDPRQYTRGG